MLNSVKTPCVGICSTGIGDAVCRGCKRFEHEVIHWNGYNNAQKTLVEQRLVKLLTQIIQNKIEITDMPRLQWQLDTQPVDLPLHRNIYCQAYVLIKAGASQIKNAADFGFQVNRDFQQQSLQSICEDIDREFYILSTAHYERYFRKTA